ncbi:MAG: hypothetical protein Q7K55_04925 [Candidatus Levybacteria bacterium]|nr:hypothetical protein [Candidatus Levybacteria bacterium]
MKKIRALKLTVFDLLKNQRMTMKELVGCLMSEPYEIHADDLSLVSTILEDLRERRLLYVSFRADPQNFEIMSVFRVQDTTAEFVNSRLT